MKYETRTQKRQHKEAGTIMVICTLTLLPLILITALVIDASLFVVSHTQQNNNAEQAALAAMRTFVVTNPPGTVRFEQRLVYEKAEEVGGMNKYVSSPGNVQVLKGGLRGKNRSGCIEFGQWNPDTGFRRTCSGLDCLPAPVVDGVIQVRAVNAIKVVLKTESRREKASSLRGFFSFFMDKNFGKKEQHIKSRAIAFYEDFGTEGALYRIVLSQNVMPTDKDCQLTGL